LRFELAIAGFFTTIQPNSMLISLRPFLSASLMTGTTKPLGVSAAKPML
jgi:hypothetical protein